MMNKTLQRIQAMREHFGWDATDTIAFMVSCVQEEAQELHDSMGDESAFASELADVLMYAFAICIDKGYDIDEIIETKIAEVMTRVY